MDMFETSVVKARVAAQRRVGVFAASIVAHTVVVTGIVAASISATSFPKNAPNEMARWMPVVTPDVPLPRGNPNAPRQPQAQPRQPQQAPQPHVQTAPPADATPERIPDAIPNVAATSTAADVTPGSGTASNEPWGVKDGDPNGIDIGQSPSTAIAAGPDVVFHPGADVKSATVLVRVQPFYPPIAARMHMSGWAFVKCIIGKNGEIRDAAVEKSSNVMFEQPALEALRQWKFAPGYYRGQAVDTYFELKITFEVR
jgi:TonB family protein